MYEDIAGSETISSKIMESETESKEIESGKLNSEAEDTAADFETDDLEQIAAAMPTNGKAKRIAAMMGVILLIVMILATFIVACLDFEGSGQVFMALILCDITIPVFLWFILHFLDPR